jgi:hypothetical protein
VFSHEHLKKLRLKKPSALSSTPEIELLLRCARTAMDEQNAAHIRILIQAPLDWDKVLYQAKRHGLSALLCRHLKQICPQAVPADVMAKLEDRFRNNTCRNIFLTSELVGLLGLLEAHQIPAVAYKGPTLTVTMYGNLALRHFNDLDILLHPTQVLAAKNLLLAQGYVSQHEFANRGEEMAHLRHACEYNLVSPDGFVVELHWKIRAHPFPFLLEFDNITERLQKITLGGQSISVLAPEDLLLILCMHGEKHCWERLNWICDVAQVIHSQPSLNWPFLLAQAKQFNSERVLLMGLYLAHHLLEAPLPSEVLTRIQDERRFQTLAAQTIAQLSAKTGSAHGIERPLFHLHMRKHFRHQLPYVGTHLRQQSRALWQRSRD